jgi:hypothetical protein
MNSDERNFSSFHLKTLCNKKESQNRKRILLISKRVQAKIKKKNYKWFRSDKATPASDTGTACCVSIRGAVMF